MIFKEDCYLKSKCNKFQNGTCQDDFCIKLYKVEELYKLSLLTDKQKVRINLFCDKDGTDRDKFLLLQDKVEKRINAFVDNGENLFIWSNTSGNGKTSWAIRLLQDYIETNWPYFDLSCHALFINVPRFLLALKDSISNTNDYTNFIKDNVLKADLVVWDEIGLKAMTDFEHEHLLNLINTRLDTNKANIYTSNIAGAVLKERIGDRLYSRIVNYSQEVEFKGQDKRSSFK